MEAAKVKAPSLRERTSWKKALQRDWHLYVMLLLPVVLVILFNYGAYPGLRMVFYDYKPAKGYDGSKWVGLQTFEKVFRDKDFLRALKNSIVFNILDLAVSFPMPSRPSAAECTRRRRTRSGRASNASMLGKIPGA